jgi:RNA polymerase sigma-70 factor, ECF subfamily
MDAVVPRMPPPLPGAADPNAGAVGAAESLAFADVYRDYFGFVWRSARGLGVRAPAVEDVVQEIFVLVHRLLPHFEGRASLRTWLSRIVLNVVRHHRRSIARRSPHELAPDAAKDPDALAADGRDPFESAVLGEEARLLQHLLDSLDEEKREILVLAELEGFSVPEIAGALGLKLNTAYSRLRLARRAFDEALARQHAQGGGR